MNRKRTALALIACGAVVSSVGFAATASAAPQGVKLSINGGDLLTVFSIVPTGDGICPTGSTRWQTEIIPAGDTNFFDDGVALNDLDANSIPLTFGLPADRKVPAITNATLGYQGAFLSAGDYNVGVLCQDANLNVKEAWLSTVTLAADVNTWTTNDGPGTNPTPTPTPTPTTTPTPTPTPTPTVTPTPTPSPTTPGGQSGTIGIGTTVPLGTEGGGTGTLALTIDPNAKVDLPAMTLNADGKLETKGALSQVKVTDTRSSRPGWSLSAQAGDFVNGSTIVDGKALGWTPKLISQSENQNVVVGAPVAPLNPGLKVGATWASAVAPNGAGTAVLGADLDLVFPGNTPAGAYNSVLTVTVI